MNDDYDDSSRLLAKNDETIYLDFETNERIDIDSLTVEINGSPLTSTDITNTNSDGKQWQASFIPTGLSSNVDSVSFQIKASPTLQATPRTRSHPLMWMTRRRRYASMLKSQRWFLDPSAFQRLIR